MIGKIKEFSSNVVAEMKKVSWPTKEQLKESTVVVLVVCAVITSFITAIDQVMSAVITWVFKLV
jgi:preprotein translocase subunit SecE